MKLFITFVILQIVNVVLQTVKSIATVKCGKTLAAIINAITFGFYTVIIIYMNCDLTLWEKVLATAATNFVGVWIVKYIEEKIRKDKLWLVQATFPAKIEYCINAHCNADNITYSSIMLRDDRHIVYNFYCATQAESLRVKELIKTYHGKYFASESKIL